MRFHEGGKVNENKLAEAINNLEDVLTEEQRKSSLEALISLKKEAGLIVDSELTFHGINEHGYVYQQKRTDGLTNVFVCDPDNIEFYQMCIEDALKRDEDLVVKQRRQKQRAQGEYKLKNQSRVNELLSPDDATKPM
jgi:hypothetical protein